MTYCLRIPVTLFSKTNWHYYFYFLNTSFKLIPRLQVGPAPASLDWLLVSEHTWLFPAFRLSIRLHCLARSPFFNSESSIFPSTAQSDPTSFTKTSKKESPSQKESSFPLPTPSSGWSQHWLSTKHPLVPSSHANRCSNLSTSAFHTVSSQKWYSPPASFCRQAKEISGKPSVLFKVTQLISATAHPKTPVSWFPLVCFF